MLGELERFDLYGHEGFTPATIEDARRWEDENIAWQLTKIEAPNIVAPIRIPIWDTPNPLTRNTSITTIWQQYQVPILVGVGTLVAIAMFGGKRRR